MRPRLILVAFFAIATQLHAQNAEKQLFTTNCSACHLLNQQVVGPSLVQIAGLYDGKEAAFIKWCHNPLPHKRKQLAQMPVMTHVPVADLKRIHAYIMKEAKGVKELKQKKGDPFPQTLSKRPLIQRMFLEKSGPASIAVALPGNLNFCWDAGTCRLRYVWQGGFLDAFPYWKGNGNSLAKLKGEILFHEAKSPIPSINSTKPQFLGYSVQDGLPTFKYQSGKMITHERITPRKNGYRRTFTFKNAPSEILLSFQKYPRLNYASIHGQWLDHSLKAKTADTIVVDTLISKP